MTGQLAPCPHVVLVVDDEPAIRESVALALEAEGYDVVTVENGAAALEHLRGAPALPCVILLDMMMPVMNGWQFLAERQADARLVAVPIVVMSAFDRAAYSGDAAQVVVKPIDPRGLLDVVERFCGGAPPGKS